MFEITLNDSKIVKGIFEAINAIVSETNMVFSPEGIVMNAIDEGRICLVGMKLDKDDFDAYKCDEEYTLGLNIDDLLKILKRSGTNDSITFKYNPNAKKISILMKDEKSKKSRRFSLQLIELSDSGIKPEALESMEYNSKVTIPISYLDEAIKDASIYSETLIMAVSDKEGLAFKASGSIGESECIWEKEDEGLESFSSTEEGEGTFALEYLKNIVKISTIAEKAELSINTNVPLKMRFSILGSSHFQYFLAPRIEEEEEEDYDENY